MKQKWPDSCRPYMEMIYTSLELANKYSQIYKMVRFQVTIIVDTCQMLWYQSHGKLTFLLAPPRDTLGVLLKSPSKLNMVTRFPLSSNQYKYLVWGATKCSLCRQDRENKKKMMRLESMN